MAFILSRSDRSNQSKDGKFRPHPEGSRKANRFVWESIGNPESQASFDTRDDLETCVGMEDAGGRTRAPVSTCQTQSGSLTLKLRRTPRKPFSGLERIGPTRYARRARGSLRAPQTPHPCS